MANVGPAQLVKENATVTLTGVANDLDPNDKLTYSWKQIKGPAVTLRDANTTFPSFTAPSNVPSGTELKFALTAKDDKGGSSNPAIVLITIMHVNHPPIANAIANRTVNPGYIATLDGSKSKDTLIYWMTDKWFRIGVIRTEVQTCCKGFDLPV